MRLRSLRASSRSRTKPITFDHSPSHVPRTCRSHADHMLGAEVSPAPIAYARERLQGLRIVVLGGGWSEEVAVSQQSSHACATALTELGAQVSCLNPSPDPEELARQLGPLQPQLVFNALHGTGGEDGYMTRCLDQLGYASTHSPAEVAALAFDKRKTRQALSHLPFADLIEPPASWWQQFFHLGASEHIDHPCAHPYVIKPICEGSSVGVLPVTDLSLDLAPRLREPEIARLRSDSDRRWMIEAYVPGMELTVSILSRGADIFPTCVTQLIPKQGFYDYRAKYVSGVTEHLCPAPLADFVAQTLLNYAQIAHTSLGCCGISRSDFRYHPSTGQIALLEVNTHPGMTALSLSPEHAAAIGLPFEDLVGFLCDEALTRHYALSKTPES